MFSSQGIEEVVLSLDSFSRDSQKRILDSCKWKGHGQKHTVELHNGKAFEAKRCPWFYIENVESDNIPDIQTIIDIQSRNMKQSKEMRLSISPKSKSVINNG